MNPHLLSRVAKDVSVAEFLLAMENRERAIKQSESTKAGLRADPPPRPVAHRELRP